MAARLPEHVENLVRYLSESAEKANEDLALTYFRRVSDGELRRQSDAGMTDGFAAGRFILELKGRQGDWLQGLFQSIAYRKKLDFQIIVVAAKGFLAAWDLDTFPPALIEEVHGEEGAPSTVGRRMASKYKAERDSLLSRAIWKLPIEALDPLFSDRSVLLRHLAQLEKTLRDGRRVRQRITIDNFKSVLLEMKQFFDPNEPIKAVRAFYSLIFGWDDENATVNISTRVPDQATFNGEVIHNLIPGRRRDFKQFVENYTVSIRDKEGLDEFFARFDEALDAVDKDFRKQHGIFFTSLDLSRFVMWLVRDHLGDIGKDYLVIDPACGSGNLISNWRSPLELRHKVVSEIEPELLYAVEKRLRLDSWHKDRYTVVPRVSEGVGLNFIDKSAGEYLDILRAYLKEKGHSPDKPLAFLCNPPYRNDDDQSTSRISYQIHDQIIDLTGDDAAAERYCCFLAQMRLICKTAKDSGLPGDSLMLVFSKAAWLTNRSIFHRIRREVLSVFEDVAGIIVNSSEFFDVKGTFPVAFTIWRYKGEARQLDADRVIPLRDLTWVTRDQLSALPWESRAKLDADCRKLLEDKRTISVPFGLQRLPIRQWAGTKRLNVYRNRRKNESAGIPAGGMPKGHPRRLDKTVYGEPNGQYVGFMDDLTPCRIKQRTLSVPWFRLDAPIMDRRKGRCLSGPPDQKGYAPVTADLEDKLFFWYGLERTFAVFGYPMWADAEDLWAPTIRKPLVDEVRRMIRAIVIADNECVETRFPANNPMVGAPLINVANPLSPLDTTSYYSTRLAPWFGKVRDESDSVVGSVVSLYREWQQLFRKQAEIPVDYRERKHYHVGDAFVSANSGLLQIRDYATEVSNQSILDAVRDVSDRTKALKRRFHEMLRDSGGINYFGEAPKAAPRPIVASTSKSSRIVARRLGVASLFVKRMHDQRHFGRTKLAKLVYLAEAHCGVDLNMRYERRAAGPLDPSGFYDGIEAAAEKHQCFSVFARSNSVMRRYKPGRNIERLVTEFEAEYPREAVAIQGLANLLHDLNTDQCEIIATLYACWNDLLLKGATIDDDAIVDEFLSNWHVKKTRFVRAKLHGALKWMRLNSLVPTGTGRRTLPPKATPDV